MTCEYFTKPF